MRAFPVIPLLLALCRGSNALNVDLNDPQSIKDAAKTIVKDVISIYDTSSTNTPGLFPQPYYWWSSGLTWDTLLDYWALTGDDEYNDLIGKSLLWQIGVDANYMPSNQTKTLGNDDQSTWALACMTAAENNFLFDASSNPYGGNTASSWLEIAQNVFDDQVLRWDTSSCGGGLRWQVFVFNAGYDYKNAASNGNFMELASRLYHYTGNKTYSDWALKVAEWSGTSGLVDAKSQTVYDGLNIPSHCNVNRLAWTADTGRYLAAIPYLSGALPPSYLSTSLTGFIRSIPRLFTSSTNTTTNSTSNILLETACITTETCNTDQYFYLAILTRAMASTIALTKNSTQTATLTNILRASAQGAAAQCSGGESGTKCGADWTKSSYDGTTGLGQEVSALNVLLANLKGKAVGTEKTLGNATATTSGSEGGQATVSASSSSGAATESVSAATASSGAVRVRRGPALGVLGALGLSVLCSSL